MSLITLSEAQAMVAQYHLQRSQILKEEHSTDILPLSITFPKSEILDLLNQDGAESCRIYFGMTGDENLISLILVAADADGRDIALADENLIIDKGQRCPVNCPEISALY